MEKTINRIIELEWKLFQNVNNKGGRASCQDDFETFYIMRKAQFMSWDERTLESYRQDIDDAADRGENIIALKYAYMMKWSDPEEYAKIHHTLPEVSGDKEDLIEDILKIQNRQTKEMYRRFPKLASRGRGIEYIENGTITVDIYAYGEFLTYSERTLRFYFEYMKLLETKGESLPEIILKNTVCQYGYSSISEAENSI